jgi:hypothetical protein
MFAPGFVVSLGRRGKSTPTLVIFERRVKDSTCARLVIVLKDIDLLVGVVE